MRRGVGIGAIRNQELLAARFKEKGQELSENQLSTLSRQLSRLRESLEAFAAKHGHKIKSDPHFRREFQAMCSSIGVDPIAYSRGCWTQTLGLGEFYYHLAIRIIEVCMANQQRTGGIMPLTELLSQLNAFKSSHMSEVTADDVQRSVRKLRCLGTGFTLFSLPGGLSLVQSVPGEMGSDKTSVLGLAESTDGHTTLSSCTKHYQWSEDRARTALNQLVQEGMAWVDDLDPHGERVFWFPSLVKTSCSPG